MIIIACGVTVEHQGHISKTVIETFQKYEICHEFFTFLFPPLAVVYTSDGQRLDEGAHILWVPAFDTIRNSGKLEQFLMDLSIATKMVCFAHDSRTVVGYKGELL